MNQKFISIVLISALLYKYSAAQDKPILIAKVPAITVNTVLSFPIPYGTYYIKSGSTKFFVDGTYGSPSEPSGTYADGTPLVMWNIAEWYANQKWVIQSDGAGNYLFKNALSGKAMDASFPQRNNNGCPVINWKANAGETQKWKIVTLANGKYSIRLASNNKALTMTSATPDNGTPLQLWDYSDTRADQQWELQRVIERAQTPWLQPVKKRGTGGDNEFFGHGPQVYLDVRLAIRNNNEVWAITDFNAKEVGGDIFNRPDGTEAACRYESMIYRGNPGEIIDYIYSKNGSYVRYTDGDHDEDFVLPADKGEQRPVPDLSPSHNWQLPNTDYSDCVKFVRFIGDHNGHDFNNAPPGVSGGTGYQVFFNDIRVHVKKSAASAAKIVNVPESFYGCGESTCSASSGSGVLNFYGHRVSCGDLWARLNSVAHITNVLRSLNIANLGVDPGTLRDKLRDFKTDIQLQQINSGDVALNRIKTNIRNNRPTIALVSWGSKAVRDSYCPLYDSYGGGSAALHYVIIRGMDEGRKLFYIIDNGEPKTWTQDYMMGAIYWRPENFVIEGGLYGVGVKPGSLIF